MWTRSELKDSAKLVLRKYYWIAFLVTLVGGILMGGSSFVTSRFRSGEVHWDWNNWNSGDYGNDWTQWLTGATGMLLGSALMTASLLVFLFSIAYSLFVSGPLQVGLSRYFIETRQDRSDFSNLFFAFRGGRYLSAVKAMGWKLLFTFLWTLLLIIPGIVKGYAYSMIPYIMAENPDMDYQRAMRLSMEMTNGEKWEMFVLDLSFIGWFLLGLAACCVGTLFVSPYFYATKAELYTVLRRKALNSGLGSEDGQGGYLTKV